MINFNLFANELFHNCFDMTRFGWTIFIKIVFLVTTVEKLVDCSDFLRVVVKGLQPTTMR